MRQRREKWTSLLSPSSSDLMRHFIALNPISEDLTKLKEKSDKEEREHKPLKLGLNQQNLREVVRACFTLRRKGEVVYGGQALGEVKEEIHK